MSHVCLGLSVSSFLDSRGPESSDFVHPDVDKVLDDERTQLQEDEEQFDV